MNTFLLISAILLIFIGFVHSILGEYKLIAPLSKQEDNIVFQEDPLNRVVLRGAWHLTTIAWWGAAIVILILANMKSPPTMAIHAMAGTFLITGLLIGVITSGRHPAWVIFLSVTGCLWVGL